MTEQSSTLQHYLGITIVRDRVNRTIKLQQTRMVKDLVLAHGLEECNPRTLPLSASFSLTAGEGEALGSRAYQYRQLVGSLMHLAGTVRPDIAFAVGALARFMSAPTSVHHQTVEIRAREGTGIYQ